MRLTSTAFRSLQAVRNKHTSARQPIGLSTDQVQAGLAFLRHLPRLEELNLTLGIRTLYGVQQLTQLQSLCIFGCHTVLDFYPLGSLPQLKRLDLFAWKASLLGNLSELRRLTYLRACQSSFHRDVSSLTALRVLHIEADGKGSKNALVYSGLTGLTSLCDDASCSFAWHKMPCLQALQVSPCPPHLLGIAAVTHLRALWLHMGSPEEGLLHLTPLGNLAHLERLFLAGRALPLPALAGLSRLSIECMYPGQTLDFTHGLPSLRELQLQPYGEMLLPDLGAHLPELAKIIISDGRVPGMGRLTINILCLNSCGFSVEHRSYLLGIDKDDY